MKGIGYYNYQGDQIAETIRILSSRQHLLPPNQKVLVSSKLWGKTLFQGKLRSEQWWRNRLNTLIEERMKEPAVELTLGPESEVVDFPIPYEAEFEMSNKNDCISYFSWLERKNSVDKI